MTEAVAITLEAKDGWRHLGHAPEAEPVEVVLRSFDRDVLFAAGSGPNAPDGAPVTVRAGEGARLTGLHFFAKPAPPPAACRILVRGL